MAFRLITLDLFNQVTDGVFGGPYCQATRGVYCFEGRPPQIIVRLPVPGIEDKDRERRDRRDLLDLLGLLQESIGYG